MKLILRREYGSEYDGGVSYHSFEAESKEIAEIELLELAEKAKITSEKLTKEAEGLRLKFEDISRKSPSSIKGNTSYLTWNEKRNEADKARKFQFYGHEFEWFDFYYSSRILDNKGRVKDIVFKYSEPEISTLEDFWQQNLP